MYKKIVDTVFSVLFSLERWRDALLAPLSQLLSGSWRDRGQIFHQQLDVMPKRSMEA